MRKKNIFHQYIPTFSQLLLNPFFFFKVKVTESLDQDELSRGQVSNCFLYGCTNFSLFTVIIFFISLQFINRDVNLFSTGDFMKKVPLATWALRDR